LHFIKAAQLKPDKAQMIIKISRALTASGHLYEATRVLQTCVTLKPENREVRFTLGLLLALDQKYESALSYFRDLAQHIQSSDTSRVEPIGQEASQGYDRAVVMEQNGRADEATALYKKVLYTQPDFFPARDRLSRLYIEKGDFKNALAIFNIKIDRKWIRKMIAAGIDRWDASWQM
jgi:tetratricopeptide (TPR) repeat protein